MIFIINGKFRQCRTSLNSRQTPTVDWCKHFFYDANTTRHKYDAHIVDIRRRHLSTCNSYHLFRNALNFFQRNVNMAFDNDIWHLLCIQKSCRFFPIWWDENIYIYIYIFIFIYIYLYIYFYIYILFIYIFSSLIEENTPLHAFWTLNETENRKLTISYEVWMPYANVLKRHVTWASWIGW